MCVGDSMCVSRGGCSYSIFIHPSSAMDGVVENNIHLATVNTAQTISVESFGASCFTRFESSLTEFKIAWNTSCTYDHVDTVDHSAVSLDLFATLLTLQDLMPETNKLQ